MRIASLWVLCIALCIALFSQGANAQTGENCRPKRAFGVIERQLQFGESDHRDRAASA